MTLLLGLLLGLPLGALGSLTGIGGGFLLMPILLWLFPDQPAGALSLVSLTVVFFNSLSGTVLSARQERVRFSTGVVYAVLSLPLVWLGTRAQALVDRHWFDVAFGLFLLAGAAFFLARTKAQENRVATTTAWWAGAVLATGIGFVSGFFGVGGGFLFVPLLAFLLGYPLAKATATSQLIVGVGAAFALATGALTHPFPIDTLLVSGLVAGVLVGSPWGTWAAGRWSSERVLRLLSILLALVALRLLVAPFLS